MRNLTPVVFDDEATIRAIIPRKHKERRERLNAALDTILARYSEYATNAAELSAINPSTFGGPLADDCRSLYLNGTDELAALKKAILDNQSALTRSVCQYCGIGEPRTFDHYASKGRFSEFSMYSLNLIPCCGTCNLDKGEGWTEKGYRHFVNFYYDTFIQHVLLHAELIFQPNGEFAVVFSLQSCPEVTANQLAIIASHYSDLGLFQRYAQRATGVISEVRKSLPRLDMRIGQINDWLRIEADSKAQVYGSNYWEAAVYHRLSTSSRFIEECLGNGWLPRARTEVAYLLGLPESPSVNQQFRVLLETRSWRLHASRGFVHGHDLDDWYDARGQLGLPDARLV